jgi:hypothetical protein
MLPVNGPVNGQDAVNMVNLVLQQFRQRSRRLDRFPLPTVILIGNDNGVMPAHTDQQLREGKAVVPQQEGPAAPANNARIEHRAADLRFNIDGAHGYPNLGRSDAAPEAPARLEIPESISQVARQSRPLSLSRTRDPPTAEPEDGIAEAFDRSNCHNAKR